MNEDLNSWDKFCNYLWFDKKLNIWLDISKINFTNEEIKNLEDKFKFGPFINKIFISNKVFSIKCYLQRNKKTKTFSHKVTIN